MNIIEVLNRLDNAIFVPMFPFLVANAIAFTICFALYAIVRFVADIFSSKSEYAESLLWISICITTWIFYSNMT